MHSEHPSVVQVALLQSGGFLTERMTTMEVAKGLTVFSFETKGRISTYVKTEEKNLPK